MASSEHVPRSGKGEAQVGRGAPVRRLSGAAAGARGSIPMPSEPPLAAETGHERPADMPNQHLRWNSVTRRPLAPPRPDWPVRRGLTSNPSATATRGRRPSSPRPTLRRISARIVIAITRLLRRPARGAHFHPAFRGAFRRSPSSSRGKGGRGCIGAMDEVCGPRAARRDIRHVLRYVTTDPHIQARWCAVHRRVQARRA